MKAIYWLVLIFSLNAACNNMPTSVVQLDQDCKPIIDDFFLTMRAGNCDGALKKLLDANENINQEDSMALDLKMKFNYVCKYAGSFLGYRLLKKRGLENDVAIYSYLVKFKRKFYRFVFVFYKPENSTKIYKFLFDDVIDVELEESLRLYTE